MSKPWQNYLKYLILFKVAILFIACFSPFVHPHIIRQVDTMGVALRYWLRWSQEAVLQFPLLPAVLTAGDDYGISTMEFPILNIVTAPFFAFGLENGRILAALFLLLFSISMICLHARIWKGKQILGIDASQSTWLFFIYSLSQGYVGRFMPDFTAFILVSISIGLSWNIANEKKSVYRKYLLPAFLASIALLMKPTAIIAFAILLLKPFQELIKKHSIYILPPVILTFLYYVFGISYIKSIADTPDYYAVHFRHPINSLFDFFKAPRQVLNLFLQDFFLGYSLFILLPVFLQKKNRKVFQILGSILLVQVLAGAILDGEHIFIHSYYYMGTSFVICLLLLFFLKNANKLALILFFSILTFFHIERSFYDIRLLFTDHIWKQCERIRKENKGDLKSFERISSPKRIYPFEGLCIGKIQNASDQKHYIEIQINQDKKDLLFIPKTTKVIHKIKEK